MTETKIYLRGKKKQQESLSLKWKYSQVWSNVLFAHWKVPVHELRMLLPEGIQPDVQDGESLISLVAFSVNALRMGKLQYPVRKLDEIIVRTYVQRNGIKGMFFLSLESVRGISSCLAHRIEGMIYERSDITLRPGFLESENIQQLKYVKAIYSPGRSVEGNNMTDRLPDGKSTVFTSASGRIWKFDVRFENMNLQIPEINSFEISYRIKNVLLSDRADIFHYSDCIKVFMTRKTPA